MASDILMDFIVYLYEVEPPQAFQNLLLFLSVFLFLLRSYFSSFELLFLSPKILSIIKIKS